MHDTLTATRPAVQLAPTSLAPTQLAVSPSSPPPPFSVHLLDEGDWPLSWRLQLTGLMETAWRTAYGHVATRAFAQDQPSRRLVATVGPANLEVPVCQLALVPLPGVLAVTGWATHRAWRRRGAATVLCHRLASLAAAESVPVLVDVTDLSMVPMLESSGFTQATTADACLPDGTTPSGWFHLGATGRSLVVPHLF
jgi:hypothetical protein